MIHPNSSFPSCTAAAPGPRGHSQTLPGLDTPQESSVRSYLIGNAGSRRTRPISEAKQPWACLVFIWGTTGEAHVLYSPLSLFAEGQLMRAPSEHLGGWTHSLIIPALRSLCCSRAVWPQATVGARNPAGVYTTISHTSGSPPATTRGRNSGSRLWHTLIAYSDHRIEHDKLAFHHGA